MMKLMNQVMLNLIDIIDEDKSTKIFPKKRFAALEIDTTDNLFTK